MSEGSFIADVRGSVALWSQATLLPTIYLGLAMLIVLPRLAAGRSGFVLLGLLVEVLALGFRATTRVWYVRLYRGRSLDGQQAWQLSWAFLGRMVRFSLIILPAYVAVVAVVGSACQGAGLSGRVAGGLGFAVAGVLAGSLLTFAVPELALSTPSALAALRSGLSLLRRHFRRSPAYVLVPPFAIEAVWLVPWSIIAAPRVILALVTLLVSAMGLACKGAITAYYLRNIDSTVSENGSLDVPALQAAT